MNKRQLQILGGGLLVLGTAVFLYPFLTIGYSNYMSDTLREQATAMVENKQAPPTETKPFSRGLYPEPVPSSVEKPTKGKVIGMLEIPSLQIKEAILEGTDEPELAKAPGHLPDSVLPGQLGKSIIAAHNATTFRHIDRLQPGDTFTVRTEQGIFTFKVTGQRILHVKDELPDTAYPALSLETCYPLDALYLTDQRLFVETALVKSELKSEKVRKER
jgi:sortase A